jgi:lipopolysaccharide biosynthesis regulator YciM
LAIVIEILAFFFLKLYRNSLERKEFVHNEMTNVEMKTLALLCSDEGNKEVILSEIVKTDRNPTLDNTQTNMRLEIEKIRREEAKNSLDILKDIIGKSFKKQ